MGFTVYWLKVTAVFTKNYIYFISDDETGETAVIDPVWDKQGIIDVLETNNLHLQSILITHSHPDHIHLANNLAQDKNCPVYMSSLEIDYYGFHCFNLTPVFDLTGLKLGNSTIIPLLTPGHTKGSLCFLAGDSLFTGDTVFIEGCGLCWGKGADPADMYRSLCMLKAIIQPETKIYPAHSYGMEPGLTFKKVLAVNIYLDFKNEEDFIAYRMRKNQKSIFAFK